MMVWLTRPRLLIVTGLMTGFNLLAILTVWLGSRGGLDFEDRPLGADFIAFWSAGWLALQGRIAEADGSLRFSQIHPLVPPGQEHILLWHYPPPFLLLLAPLALLPYVPAVLSFTAISLTVAAGALRSLTHDRLGWLLLLGAPATLLSILGGQTGLLVAALAGAGLALRPTCPTVAGLVLSGLVIKPHFLALIPVFLLLQRDWRTLASLTAGSLILCGLSLFFFGPQAWDFFISNAASARTILETGTPPWDKMGSMFVTARLLGAGTEAAWWLHKAAVLLAVALAWRPLQRRDALAPATLLLLTLVAAPYQFDYDLVLLLPVIAFWVQAAAGTWRTGEQAVLMLLWFGPVFTVPLAMTFRLGLMPFLLLAALALISRRTSPAGPGHTPAA